jgi:hypothetical protein
MNANLNLGRKLLGIIAACAAANAAIAGPPGGQQGSMGHKSIGSQSSPAVRATPFPTTRIGTPSGRVSNGPGTPILGKPATNQGMPIVNKPPTGRPAANPGLPQPQAKPRPSGPLTGQANGQNSGKHGQPGLQHRPAGTVGSWMQKPVHGQPRKVFSQHCNTNYCYQYGVKKSFGFCYDGFNHNHWYCRSYSEVNGCWLFYDASCTNWYYWCQPANCYYPCSYKPYGDFCATAPVYAAPVCTTPVCEPVATYSTTTPIDVTSRYLVTTHAQVPALANAATPVFAAPKPVYNGAPQPVFSGTPQPVASGPAQGLPGPIPPMPGEVR